jgi:hypothetical protein
LVLSSLSLRKKLGKGSKVFPALALITHSDKMDKSKVKVLVSVLISGVIEIPKASSNENSHSSLSQHLILEDVLPSLSLQIQQYSWILSKL